MNSNAAVAQFVSIEDKVVAFRPHFPRRGFELFEVFVDDTGEGMLSADPGFVGIAPLKQRKAGEPEKLPLRFVDYTERLAKLQAQLAGDQSSRFGTFDLLLRGNSYDQVAGLCPAGLGEFLDVFRTDQFFDGGA